MKLKSVFVVATILAQSALAVVSPNVSANWVNYELIDRLEAYGCAYSTLRAVGPQTQNDLRMALVADSEEFVCRAPQWLLIERERLARPLAPGLRTELIFLSDDRRSLLGIGASVFPMIPFREGRQTFNGGGLYLEPDIGVSAQSGDLGIAISATPGWVGGLENYREADGRFYLQEGYVKVGYGWSDLTYGRTALRFGQTKHGGLLLSGATAPLDVYKFTMRPHLLGETFGFLGPVTFETWVADQGDGVPVPGTKLWGIEIGMRPLRSLEFAFLEVLQFGGTGAPSLETSDYFKMAIFSGEADLDAKRNRALGGHFAFWGPERNWKLYTQAFFSDLHQFSDWFFKDVSLLAGFWLPKLGDSDLRLEYVRISDTAYEHAYWRQGLTYKGTPLGHPLGPDAEGTYVDLGLGDWDGWRPDIGLIYEARALHAKGAARTEWRYGGNLGLKRRWGIVEAQIEGIYHYVVNPFYQSSQPLSSLAGQAVVRISLF